jgi:predicted nucleic acid-binding protein
MMNWTRQWWSEFADRFALVTSTAVIAELRRGEGALAQQRISLLKQMPLLEISPYVEDVARIYIERLVMPRDPAGDALHLALACVHRVDVLLTWNCRHLANPSKICELGLPTPVLTTPLNYLAGDEADVE